MEPFLEWDLKVLPVAVRWLHRAMAHVRDDQVYNVDLKKLSAIYQFARAEPMMFVASASKGSERKIDKVG